ncbi:fibronectin type-III domain-containing protein 3A-like [Protopterus annectens]|uniref:fibronectin type-III domain-containing protein 3A-like n=1 Tax=Protopterus annectens TaxID=7888 RepID=UPI001CF9B231|nr:fibronectin type-III domain-containing protein 3A-like [Protopterus annectens]
MNFSVMMADQPPPLEATPLISEVALLPHVVGGEAAQQVILVQVNPGETFTIRTEDGHFQCIPGPAQVPMMSPNGTMPPIFVPPGYISQVVEENGMRKVMVLPHSADFLPSLHPHLAHVPHYLHQHPLLPHQPHPMYSTVPGDLPTQFIHQHALPPHIYAEQESRLYGRINFIQRDERNTKMHEQLRKRLNDRQNGHNNNTNSNKLSSPPPSPQKSHTNLNAHVQNGYGKGSHFTGISNGAVRLKQLYKIQGSPPSDTENGDSAAVLKGLQDMLPSIDKPIVSSIQARSALVSWSPPLTSQNSESQTNHLPTKFTYEVAVSSNGKNGKFKSVYTGEETTVTLPDLRPATDYFVKVSAFSNSLRGSSETVSFTTECSEPDPPAPPRLVNKTKSSLSMQWKAPNDNGSKIINYLLEWDEGISGAFKEYYTGHLKQCKLNELLPSTRYSFRLAAINEIGMSGFSETVEFHTSGNVPPPPSPPSLSRAGVSCLSLEWSPPSSVSSEEPLTYILEMEEESTGYGFKPKYSGEECICTLKNLRRSTSYKFRVFACNSEGKSSASEIVEYSTCPDKPGPPNKPCVKGKIQAHSLKVAWEPPKDDGGSEIMKYVLEISETLHGIKWDMVYSGSLMECLCNHLKPGTWYRLRVYCISCGGQSQVSEVLPFQTAAVPPGPCQPPHLHGLAKAKEVILQWGAPDEDGGAEVTEYSLEMANAEHEEHVQVYNGLELQCTVRGLLPGKSYCFWAKAANKAGYGPYSEKSVISTAPGPPDQCDRPLLICKTATSVLAKWESPACNGAEVTEYRLEWGGVEGCMQVVYTGSCLSYEIKGLTPATTYYCRVQAVNAVGTGLFGSIAWATTPASMPTVVCDLNVLEDGLEFPCFSPATCLALYWTEPHCNGSEILGYNIEYGERQLMSVDRVTSCILENLQPDTAYRIRIQAVNEVGVGSFSQPIKAKTRPLPPEPPHIECVVFSHQSLKLKWGDGPSKVLMPSSVQFNLQMKDKYDRFVCIYRGPCHKYKVQRLNEFTVYNFRIQACSSAGEGPFSDIYTFMTTKSPPPPLKAPRVQQVEDNLCEISWEALQPMRGDNIFYTLQLSSGKENEQVYKGSGTSFSFTNFQSNCEYRFKVCACRRYEDSTGVQEMCGPYSPSAVFLSQKQELLLQNTDTVTELWKIEEKSLSDEQFAFLLLVGFATVAVMFAIIMQHFVIK